ncbi:MAG: glycosyltransferase family 4 protein [Gemmataceae bacterium]|nr:glycosyltransferase family 4 protein [Gemmataceae bacterium]MCI0739338.1 glycosyltransferase family 4 protein [Gemmataceae bacterium]
MTPRQLLLVTYHFPPSAASGSFRLLGFARHLPTSHWQVTVVSPPELPWEPVDAGLSRQVPPETTVCHVPYPKAAPKFLRWAAPYAVWLPRAWRVCRTLADSAHFDAVLTSGPPHSVHWVGLKLKKRFRLPWFADFRDPWVHANPVYRFRGMKRRWWQYWERKVLKYSDAVLANTPGVTNALRTAYPRFAAKMHTLTNGFDPWESAMVRPYGGRSELHLVHAGELYAGRDPRPLLDALARLHSQGNSIHFEILGRNSTTGLELDAEIERRGLCDKVRFRGQLPYQQALDAMAGADVLLLLDSPGRTLGVPAKLYEYFGAGRPILALAEPDSDVAKVLADSGVPYRLAAPRDAGAIADALAELTRIAISNQEAQPPEQFTRAHLTKTLAHMLEGHRIVRAKVRVVRKPVEETV